VSANEDGVSFVKLSALDTELYAQALRLREAVLRKPLGLVLTEEERADDALRHHFCAVEDRAVVGTVSLKPLGSHAVQLRQMAVDEGRRGEKIGAGLLAVAEAWACAQGFRQMVLNARKGAEGFYAKFGYGSEGDPFEENTVPHIRMVKQLA
jgi:predicted GNAT family N-acyltransferase